MSQPLSRIINLTSLSNAQITNLYLYGTLDTPLNLSDRVRPLVEKSQQQEYEEGKAEKSVDIIVNLDATAARGVICVGRATRTAQRRSASEVNGLRPSIRVAYRNGQNGCSRARH